MAPRNTDGIELGDVDAVEADGAVLRRDRNAASAGRRWICPRRDGPTSATASPGRDVQREIMHAALIGPGGIMEGDMLETHAPLGRSRQRHGMSRRRNGRLFMQQFHQPFRRRRRRAADRPRFPTSAPTPPADQDAIDDELHQHAAADLTGHDIVQAHQRDGGQAGEGGEDRDRRENGARQGAARGRRQKRVRPWRRIRGARIFPG